jgi:hypothetical protein
MRRYANHGESGHQASAACGKTRVGAAPRCSKNASRCIWRREKRISGHGAAATVNIGHGVCAAVHRGISAAGAGANGVTLAPLGQRRRHRQRKRYRAAARWRAGVSRRAAASEKKRKQTPGIAKVGWQ